MWGRALPEKMFGSGNGLLDLTGSHWSLRLGLVLVLGGKKIGEREKIISHCFQFAKSEIRLQREDGDGDDCWSSCLCTFFGKKKKSRELDSIPLLLKTFEFRISIPSPTLRNLILDSIPFIFFSPNRPLNR